jgi:hypothetical protein
MPPPQSPDQRDRALALAQEVRVRRAQLKRDLKHGRCSIDTVLRDPPSFIATAKVIDILRAMPGYGPVKASKIIKQCRVAPSKTIGGLTQRQRNELSVRLER